MSSRPSNLLRLATTTAFRPAGVASADSSPDAARAVPGGELCPGIFDAVGGGGGPAGAVTALELARAGRRTLVLDHGGDRGGEAVATLPPSARPLLRRLGLEADLRSLPHLRCAGLQSAWAAPSWPRRTISWCSTAPAATSDAATPCACCWRWPRRRVPSSTGVPASGWSAGRPAAGRDLGRRDAARARRLRPLSDRRQRPERVFLRRHGVAVEGHDRLAAQIAVFAAAAGTEDGEARSLIEAEADGWWATARLPDRRRLVVRFTEADPVDREAPPTRGEFLARLPRTRFVRSRVLDHGYALARDPHTRPLDVSRPLRLVGERAARAVDRDLGGDPEKRNAYVRDAARRFADHLARRGRIYARERRWSDRGFWSRRGAVPLTAAPPAPSTPDPALSNSDRAATP